MKFEVKYREESTNKIISGIFETLMSINEDIVGILCFEKTEDIHSYGKFIHEDNLIGVSPIFSNDNL